MKFVLNYLEQHSSFSPAIYYNKTTYSFLDLSNQLKKSCTALNTILSPDSKTIALIASNSDKWAITALAIWQLGKTLIPINPDWKTAELQSALIISEADTIIYEDSTNINFDTRNLKPIKMDKIFATDDIKDIHIQYYDSPALGIFTSGSTGNPNLVMHSWSALIKHAEMSEEFLGFTNEDKWMISLPLFHIGGISTIIKMLISGLSIIISDSTRSEILNRNLNDYEPTIMSLVPTQLKRLLELQIDKRLPDFINFVLVGGGPLNKKLINSDKRLFGTYGLSEAGSQVATRLPLSDSPALFPLPGIKINILDDTGKELPRGAEGHIHVKTPSVMLGYKEDGKINNDIIKNGWLNTGDYGKLGTDGTLRPLTRREDRIISGGENIDPIEVSRLLMSHPKINDVFILPLKDDDWGQIVSAAIISDNNINIEELKSFVADKLSSYKIPKKWLFMNDIPLLASGKPDKLTISRLIRENGVE